MAGGWALHAEKQIVAIAIEWFAVFKSATHVQEEITSHWRFGPSSIGSLM